MSLLDLSVNCIFCSHCCCFRSISEYSFHDDGIHLITCIYCQFTRKKQSQQKLQTQQNPSQQISHYCSSCTQLRELSQFGQFKTCEICRTINKRSKRQRIQKIQLYNQRTRVSFAKSHLWQWVQLAGEEKMHIAAHKSLLSFHKWQLLTIDHYLQEEEPEQLRKKWLDRRQQWKQKQEQQKQKRAGMIEC